MASNNLLVSGENKQGSHHLNSDSVLTFSKSHSFSLFFIFSTDTVVVFFFFCFYVPFDPSYSSYSSFHGRWIFFMKSKSQENAIRRTNGRDRPFQMNSGSSLNCAFLVLKILLRYSRLCTSLLNFIRQLQLIILFFILPFFFFFNKFLNLFDYLKF